VQEQLQEMGRDSRLDVRIPRILKNAIAYAAKLQGLNQSDFIIVAVANEASRVINENHVIRLTLQDQQTLLEALNASPKEPTEKARRAAEKYRKDVAHGRVVIQH
jgi:uncharacterized protein (DUF1778 family)